MEKNLIGELISKIRKEKEWTQKDLAMKLNVSDKTVSKWETGHGIPDIGSLETIAEALEISVGELLAGKRFPEENLLKSSDEVLVKTMKTSKKKMYKVLIGVFVAALLFVFILLGMIFYEYHLADTVNPADEEAFRKYALSAVKECYGTNENTEILGIKKKEMYIAVVFRDENGCYMIHFEQDKIFENRYHVSGAEEQSSDVLEAVTSKKNRILWFWSFLVVIYLKTRRITS